MRLGEVLRKWRLMNELDLRTASRMIGIGGAATLLRIEQGRECDGSTLVKIIVWLTGKETGK